MTDFEAGEFEPMIFRINQANKLMTKEQKEVIHLFVEYRYIFAESLNELKPAKVKPHRIEIGRQSPA